MKERDFRHGLALGVVGMLAGIGLNASATDLADIRLGARDGAVTRVVFDLRGGGAGFSYRLSDDGMTLIVALRAGGKSPAMPHRQVGLVQSVTAAAVTNGTRISIASTAPLAVVENGVLAAEGRYRFHRIYFDLGQAAPSPAGLASAPAAAPDPPAMIAATAAATIGEAMPEAPRPEMQEEEAPPAEGGGDDPHHPEPAVTVKLGGIFERSVSDYSNSGGPTAALQTGMFHDALELELGGTALLKNGQTSWKTGLILKKPIELSESGELAIGAGPIWLHRPHLGEDDNAARDSAGVEGVLEFVYWPDERHSLGLYTETGYSYDFGKGHEKAAGAGGGVLIPLP